VVPATYSFEVEVGNPVKVFPHTIELFDFHWAIEFGLKESVIGVLEGVSVFDKVPCIEAT
jgi:hypothetical protein